MKKLLQITNGSVFIAVIVINYLSTTGAFNGNTVGGVSGQYHNYFTPAGYAFTIWSLIYLGLGAFVIYQARSLFNQKASDEIVFQVGWWFVISCFANIFWIVTWVYDFTGLSVLIMALLLFSLIRIIVRTNMEMEDAPLHKIAFVWWPFSAYSGWITVAFIANTAAYLTKIEWRGFGISPVSWTVIMIFAAGVIYMTMTWTRNMREFALVGVWGLVAIAVANWGEVPVIANTALAVAAILFISSGIHGFINRKSFPPA
ncbi:hypothetical protein SAMN05443144_1288 [Fodinibius roseus]|uniref:TspO and MBR related proteins n=1 Tax=Fodinibius roseus TaxID=1194090 RepID=A0A1M5JPM8_9BACT|nr:hypothetical protein [Fodinibius roseus]SHG42517.1 hypothetical protein SAMN05443144_1288 [Fodinibius roseus]